MFVFLEHMAACARRGINVTPSTMRERDTFEALTLKCVTTRSLFFCRYKNMIPIYRFEKPSSIRKVYRSATNVRTRVSYVPLLLHTEKDSAMLWLTGFVIFWKEKNCVRLQNKWLYCIMRKLFDY